LVRKYTQISPQNECASRSNGQRVLSSVQIDLYYAPYSFPEYSYF
jgi:hypothetical protein